MGHTKLANGNNVCQDVEDSSMMNVSVIMFLHIIAFQKLIALTPMVLSHVPVKQDSMTSMVTVVFVSKLMNALMRLTTVTN